MVDINRLLDYYRDEPEVYDAVKRLEHDRTMMKKMKPYAALHYLYNAMGYFDHLKKAANGNEEVFRAQKKTADEILMRAKRGGEKAFLRFHDPRKAKALSPLYRRNLRQKTPPLKISH